MRAANLVKFFFVINILTSFICYAQNKSSITSEEIKTSRLLQADVKKGQAIIWHLYHSGFVIKTSDHLLIFDYRLGDNIPKGGQGLQAGLINPDELKDENVIVFISHEHYDHFYEDSFDWIDKIKKIHFIVSPEVSRDDSRFKEKEGLITTIAANNIKQVGNLWIKTLLATDSGVAFLVKIDGLTIYHSGDHANWNWKNDPRTESRFASYHLKPLEGEKIDIAMQTCDTRLKGKGWGGFFTFARKLKPGLIIPMHLNGDYSNTKDVEKILKEKNIDVPYWPVKYRGDYVKYPFVQSE